jgi:L-cysteine S-thiosulfotransferase
MKIASRLITVLALVLAAGLADAAETSSWGPGADDASFNAMLKSSFREKGIAKLSRLDQDETQAFCSDPTKASSKEGAKRAAEIEAINMATVKWPKDNVWLGDYRAGETLAQSGRGLTSTDTLETPNGGNCYNCHQLSKAEISYGTIGPSLYNYGKARGATDESLRYAWAKIYNAKASNACSNMPRAGHMGIITEKQIKDLMALLFDPESPVNK